MVAALEISTEPTHRPRHRHLRLVAAPASTITAGYPATADRPASARRPRLAAVPDTRASWWAGVDPVLVGAVIVGLVLALALVAVRLGQDAPSAAGGVGLPFDPREPVTASAGPGDQIRVARPGDTYWALAQELRPGNDPRPVVDRLVEANGSTAIMTGQEIVVPADLIGGSGLG